MAKSESKITFEVDPMTADDAEQIVGMIQNMGCQVAQVEQVMKLKTQLSMIAEGKHVVAEKK